MHRSRKPLTVLALLLGLLLPGAALASGTQVSLMQDDTRLYANPAGTLQTMRELGATVVRVTVPWAQFAPAPNSFRAPRFAAANPAAYPAAPWGPLDAIVRIAARDGITVDLDPAAPVPLWATGPGMPHASRKAGYPFHNWRPNAAEFGQFMRALGTRYGGSYDPALRRLAPGNPGDLPRVHFWSIWNEPDYGPHLAPQGVPGHRGVEASPPMYRALVDQAWSALAATGHTTRTDTILIGELAPRSEDTAPTAFGNFNGMTPLRFLDALYCVDARYRPLRGEAAAIRDCPTTAAASAHFVAANPGLFRASAYSDHPYMYGFPPDRELNSPRTSWFGAEIGQYATLATIGNLEHALDRLVAVYHQRTRFPIWNTEYGIITNPPHRAFTNGAPGLSWAMAAEYDNWAEYLSWKDPRLASFAQYLVQDPLPPGVQDGGFASGLITWGGVHKDTFDAFRLPLYLPRTVAPSASRPLEVWGEVRPLHFAQLDAPHVPERVTVMFRPRGQGGWQPLSTVTPGAAGYFDTHIAFPVSGAVRLQWTYPAGTLDGLAGVTIDSRTVSVAVK
jgi:hypothetical protein